MKTKVKGLTSLYDDFCLSGNMAFVRQSWGDSHVGDIINIDKIYIKKRR